MTIADLHKLAYTRFPRASVHDVLHEAAMAFPCGTGVSPVVFCQSLTDLSPAQLEQLARWVRGFPVLANSQQPTANSSRHAARSGQPREPGIVRMISDAQKHLIHGLACEMRWSQSTLTNFLRTHFECDSIDALATSKRASAAINQLMGYKRAKQRTATRARRTG